jgi:hypothetical protein
MTETLEPSDPDTQPEPEEEQEPEEEPDAEPPVDDTIKGASPAPPTDPGERSNAPHRASLFARLFRKR